MSRRILLILIIVLVLAAVGYGFLPGSVLVETAVVSRGPLAVTLVEEGETRVKERFVIAATVDGMVCRIDLDVGDPVEAGQLLAYLEPLPPTVLDPRSRAEARARVATAEAQLQAAWEQAQAAEADAEYAAQELARLERLFQAGNLSQGQLDQARAGARRTGPALPRDREDAPRADGRIRSPPAIQSGRETRPRSSPKTASNVPAHRPAPTRICRKPPEPPPRPSAPATPARPQGRSVPSSGRGWAADGRVRPPSATRRPPAAASVA